MERVSALLRQASSSNRYATLFYAEYNPVTRCFSYVNGGHNPPVVLRNEGGSFQEFRLEAGGPVIGLLRHRYERGVFSLEPGDVVVLFTDGVSESMNAHYEEWGEDRLIDCAKTSYSLPPAESLRRILSAAQSFAAGAPQHDDMTLVVLRVS